MENEPLVRNFREVGHALLWMSEAMDASFNNGKGFDEGSPIGPALIMRLLGEATLQLDEHQDNNL